jgi:hypothetical protein
MLGYYLKFNGVQFPNPKTPSRSQKTIENVSQSEAGTDLVCVVRAAKNTWSFSFNLSSKTRDILKAICQQESTSMTYMGTTYTVRVRDFKEKLVENSEWVTLSEGLYECSVNVTEF